MMIQNTTKASISLDELEKLNCVLARREALPVSRPFGRTLPLAFIQL